MNVKGIALFSGGLDSSLAFKVIEEQGIEVSGITFETPFFGSARARASARRIGLPLTVLNITDEHLHMLHAPRYGYGKNMNPCIDCHSLMLREAGRVMDGDKGDFLFTGEVLGQRPMSQNKGSLHVVERESGYEGRILRPLSARLLAETTPEQSGQVDRERLLDISGRSRKRQMELAKRYQITQYLTPGGGCLLTDPGFSRRLGDLFRHHDNFQIRDIELLKIGRHLRFSPAVKVIAGRRAEDNERIMRLMAPGDDLLKVEGYPGPLVLIPYGGSMDDIQRAASICVRYSDAPKDEVASVIWSRNGAEKRISVRSCPLSLPAELMI